MEEIVSTIKGILDSGYVQLTVNHSDSFVDSETDANIQDKWGLKDAELKFSDTNSDWKSINESSAIEYNFYFSIWEIIIDYQRTILFCVNLMKWNVNIKKIYFLHFLLFPH